MNHSLLHQSSHTQLIRQLLFFDEERNGFLNAYFPGNSKHKRHAEELISRYCAVLEQLLSDFNDEELNYRVLIGSRLNLHDLEHGTSDSFTLVFPAHTDPLEGKISWLSPLGMQLLMAEARQDYNLEVPSGILRVRLDSIRFEGGEVERKS